MWGGHEAVLPISLGSQELLGHRVVSLSFSFFFFFFNFFFLHILM